MASGHPDREIAAEPVSPFLNGIAVTFRFVGVTTSGQTVAATSAVIRQGMLCINEDPTNDGEISVASSANRTLLPKRVNDVVTPIFVPGQGSFSVFAKAATITISGWVY